MNKKLDFGNPVPLYLQIERDIKKRIKNGELKIGEQISTNYDLAVNYSVSLITVKKALANLIKEGILFSRIGMGTFVAGHVENRIDLSRHKTIGLVLRDLKHPYFSLIEQSVEERAYELGYNVLLTNSSGDIQKEENQIKHFRKLGVDGLIIASLSLEYRATDYIQKLHKEKYPYVMVSYIHDPDYWYVGSNHELGGFLATEHLIKLGYKTIGYVHVGKGNLLCEVRKNGYSQALMDNDVSFDSRLIFYLSDNELDLGGDRFESGYKFGKRFLAIKNKPEALYVYNDLVALGLMQSLIEGGMKIPDDLAIIGNDDLDLTKYAPVPLTTIHQASDMIGRKAVEIIRKRIEGIDTDNRTIFRPSLVIRESCGALKKSAEYSIKQL